jgi:hypothetical protein
LVLNNEEIAKRGANASRPNKTEKKAKAVPAHAEKELIL